ncbi:hypothetical protein BKA66DRAFT_447382 [Pyrenochaeta sp. MPI-SDFR-AT-0127]|nr:hypothetical protein BKA66DRAFT_447382 [Pyrenochaeta sp. MPI-SDFR-AT-0127]
MAPTKSSAKGKSPKGKSSSSKSSSKSSRPKSTGKEPEGISKRKQKSMSLAKPGGAQKSKSLTSKSNLNRKKKRVYTEKELDIPLLNSIIPAGIAKPKGEKKGKIFVDDPASMMAIMSVVHAEKEGRLESKIMRARQLEEIREAKRKEADERSDEKKEKFEERKQALKKKRKRHSEPARKEDVENEEPGKKFKPRKRVSFG